jgi:hypothetical protein
MVMVWTDWSTELGLDRAVHTFAATALTRPRKDRVT